MTEKLKLTSKDIVADKKAQLKQLFPEIFTEGDKIVYEKLEGIQYERTKFKDDEHKLFYPEEMIMPATRSIYNYVKVDSHVERRFAKDLEANKQQVKYYIKLPNWFTIDTPVGKYNPDWAILKQNGDVVYMVRETKSTKEQLKLRITESDKIRCGKAHFENIGVNFEIATSIKDVNLNS